jgi:hypothetical protein
MNEDNVVTAAAEGLGVIGAFVGGVPGLALQAAGRVIPAIYTAIKGGGQPDDVVGAITQALVAASNAEMKATLGP